MITPLTRLTLGEIADFWADENAGKPFAKDREEILDRFLHGLKNHEFDHATLKLKRKSKDVFVGLTPVGDGSYTPERRKSGPWEKTVNYQTLAQTLFRNPVGDRLVYLEALIISKDHFGVWCDRQKFSRPRFWFDRSNPSADGTTGVDKGSPEAANRQDAEADNTPGKPDHSAEQDHEGSAPVRDRPGRPSFRNDILTAYQVLKDRGEIDFAAPMTQLYPNIRRKVKEARRLDSDTGLATK